MSRRTSAFCVEHRKYFNPLQSHNFTALDCGRKSLARHQPSTVNPRSSKPFTTRESDHRIEHIDQAWYCLQYGCFRPLSCSSLCDGDDRQFGKNTTPAICTHKQCYLCLQVRGLSNIHVSTKNSGYVASSSGVTAPYVTMI